MKEETVTIDGSMGEGGGQILRTSLALSMIMGRTLRMARIDLIERGQIRESKVTAIVACLPESIGHREVCFVKDNLDIYNLHVAVRQVVSPGPGNALFIEFVSDGITEMITAFGKRGVASEAVAMDAVKEAKSYIASGAPVGPYLADQILIPMALANRGAFRTCQMTQHTLTNINVIKRFIDVNIEVRPIDDKVWHIEIG